MKKKRPAAAMTANLIEKNAGLLYRCAILSLGDAEQATQAALAACVEISLQYDHRPAPEPEVLRHALLRNLYQRCLGLSCPYQIKEAAAAFPELSDQQARLLAVLAALEPKARGLVALRCACGLSHAQALAVSGADNEQMSAALSQAARQFAERELSML